jgi:mannose-6-phosphate isomerase-like protein (cupin superfamily)
MEIYTFGKATGRKIDAYQSNFVMSRIVRTTHDAHIGCMHLEKEGLIGYHQATLPQLLLIVSGEGLVRGEEERGVSVYPGDAVFWTSGEWHETTSQNGLTAIVIESEGLDPVTFMALKK